MPVQLLITVCTGFFVLNSNKCKGSGQRVLARVF